MNPCCSRRVRGETRVCGAFRGTYFADSITKADEYARRKAVGSMSACLCTYQLLEQVTCSAPLPEFLLPCTKGQACLRTRDRWRRANSLDVELQRSAEPALVCIMLAAFRNGQMSASRQVDLGMSCHHQLVVSFANGQVLGGRHFYMDKAAHLLSMLPCSCAWCRHVELLRMSWRRTSLSLPRE